MFPHLIAGPIVRYADIRDEMQGDRRRTGHVGLGFQYFIVGLCQKVLVANTVAPLADHAFGLDAAHLGGPAAWLGVWAYTLQIYFDFCGYSNMAHRPGVPCWASPSRRTSTTPTFPSRSPSSGGAGT